MSIKTLSENECVLLEQQLPIGHYLINGLLYRTEKSSPRKFYRYIQLEPTKLVEKVSGLVCIGKLPSNYKARLNDTAKFIDIINM